MPPTFKSRLGVAVAGFTTMALLALGTLGAQPAVTAQPAPADDSAVQDAAVRMVTDGVRVDRARTIVATTPSRVTVGERIVVRGTVKVRAGAQARPRPVRLLERLGTRTTVLIKKKSTRKGTFVFRFPAGTRVASRSFVVSAPKSAGLGAARARLNVEVVAAYVPPPVVPEVPEVPVDPEVPPVDPEVPEEPEVPVDGYDPAEPVDPNLPTPLGVSSDYSYLFAGGSRWNPCQVIDWGYDPEGGYTGSLTDMKRSFAKLSGYTGLKFKYQGLTGDDFNIRWSNEAEDPQLGGGVVGYAGAWAWVVSGEDVAHSLFDGYMILDEQATLRPGYDVTGSPTWGQVMLHETLHSLGLGHAAGSEQVMNAYISSVNHLFGAGDNTGMVRIGAQQGCM